MFIMRNIEIEGPKLSYLPGRPSVSNPCKVARRK